MKKCIRASTKILSSTIDFNIDNNVANQHIRMISKWWLLKIQFCITGINCIKGIKILIENGYFKWLSRAWFIMCALDLCIIKAHCEINNVLIYSLWTLLAFIKQFELVIWIWMILWYIIICIILFSQMNVLWKTSAMIITKRIVHPKTKMMLSFTHSHVVTNLYDLVSSLQQKRTFCILCWSLFSIQMKVNQSI